MKIDLKEELKRFDGTKLLNSNEKAMTVEEVIVGAYTRSLSEDANDTSKDRFDRWTTLKKISEVDESGIVELTSEECTTIKNRVLKIYLSPEVYGNICDIIDS